MIDLTPLEVRKKKGDFRRVMRGYDSQSVDDFLDLVADRLEQVVREHASMSERIAGIEAQVSDYRERERALTEALVTAQEMREQMRKQMEREVELKLREAEADAEAVRSAVAQQREREEESIRRLRARQAQFIQSYRSFLERELQELSVMTEALDLDAAAAVGPERHRRKRPRPIEPLPAPELTPQPEPTVTTARRPEAVITSAPPPEPVITTAPPQPVREIVPVPLAASTFVPPAVTPLIPEPEIPVAAEGAQTPGPDLFDEPLPFEREPVEPDDLAWGDELFESTPAAQPTLRPAEEFIDLAKHFPEPEKAEAEEDVPELELIDEVSEDEDKDKHEDNDGWISTLLEGKGD